MRLAATIVTAVLVIFACITTVNAAAEQGVHRAIRGKHCERSCPVSQGWQCSWWWQRLWSVNPTPAQVKRCMIDFFQSIPQEHVAETVQKALQRRAEDSTPNATYFFVGDNGVGKTHLAQAISLILSPCPDDTGKRGNLVFEFDCMAINSGLEKGLGKRRNALIASLIAHMASYPNAVFIFNEVHLLGDSLDLLAPLVSGTHFPGSDVMFDTATVIMTMDLSESGGTEHRSIDDVMAITLKELELWPQDVSSAIRERALIVPFPPFGFEGYKMVIRYLLNRVPCRHHWIDSLTFAPREVTTMALMASGTFYRHGTSGGNGRAASKIVQDVVEEFKRVVRAQMSQAMQASQDIHGQVIHDISGQTPQRNGQEVLPRCALELTSNADGGFIYTVKIL